MANTEKTSDQSTSAQDTSPASAPEVIVNTSSNPAPADNKVNANMLMALVLCFMLIIGLALAFVFKWDGEKSGGNNQAELAEKEKLQRLIDAERGGVSSDSRASAAALEARISSVLENIHAIKSDSEVMKAGYVDAKEKLAQAENIIQGNMNTISRLGSQNEALNNQIKQLQTLARNAKAYQDQAQSYAQSNAEKEALIATLQDRPSAENIQQLRDALSSEQMTKAELMRKVQALEQKMKTMLDPKETADLTELQTQNKNLRRQLQALQTSIDFGKLFVDSHTKLPQKAQSLYTALKGLEGSSQEELIEAYTKIAAELNAENLQQVKFATGSSILNFTDQTTIKSKLDATNEDDYFLVVGYASKSGDATQNETLSANRATAVASIVNQLKKDGQDVRAVYLGQTDRFSKTEHAYNQLCEIWRIKK